MEAGIRINVVTEGVEAGCAEIVVGHRRPKATVLIYARYAIVVVASAYKRKRRLIHTGYFATIYIIRTSCVIYYTICM